MSAPRDAARLERPPVLLSRREHVACGTAHSQPIGNVRGLLDSLGEKSRTAVAHGVRIAGCLLLLVITGCARSAPPPATAPPPAAAPPALPQLPPAPVVPGPATSVLVRLGPEEGGRVVRLSLEAYVAGTLIGEQPVRSLAAEVVDSVLELQALLSRTFALANPGRHAREGFDLCATTHCQVSRTARLPPDRQAHVDRAVALTAGRVIAFEGRPIQALFHANCGGQTSAAEDVWGGDGRPYLRGRPDPCARWTPVRRGRGG